MLHEMKLQNGPFNSIKNGKKTIELRLYDEKRQKVKIRDKIEFMLRFFRNVTFLIIKQISNKGKLC